jgi:hypothetical protein
MWPTPPTPSTTAVVPGRARWAMRRTAWKAVMPASACGATSAGSSPGGSLMSWRSVTSRYSAKPPSSESPRKSWLSQCMSSPRRQATQSPQL